jgi:hypothetical protein
VTIGKKAPSGANPGLSVNALAIPADNIVPSIY